MESLIGQTLDSYKILEIRGRGGMGVVFKALDTNLDKIVALKMIDPTLAKDDTFIRRFRTEARALARLDNPNIVSVYAFRETSSYFFMVMEYIEAKPLSQCIRENGKLKLEDILKITKQLLSAIGFAHKADIIHRDIKPSNILICHNGTAKVTDFGLAKVIKEHESGVTVTQVMAGTLYYMSPEQIKGLKNVDKRGDIYSLGMTIYEMIVGRVPFEKTDSDFTIQRKIVDGEIPSPLTFCPDVPKKLTKIILKSIAKDPEKRYQSAEEMLEAVQKFEVDIVDEEKTIIVHSEKEKVQKKSFLRKPAFIISTFLLLLGLTLVYLFLIVPVSNNKLKVFLSLSTNPPGAKITVNDQVIGNSPLDQFVLDKEGDITLLISKQGFDLIDTLIRTEFGKKLNLAFSLTPNVNSTVNENHTVASDSKTTDSGSLNITSIPDGAEVLFNGKSIGVTPLGKSEIPTGTHRILLRKGGFGDYKQSVVISANKTTTVSTIKLSRVGELTISTEPTDAEIIIDDKLVGAGKYTSDKMNLGEHNITVRKNGFKQYNANIKIEADKPINISPELVPLVGQVKLLVRPSGDIYVDGQLKVKNAFAPYQVKISGGIHNLRVINESLGEWIKKIEINNESLQKFNIDFGKGKLKIISKPTIAEILINERSTGRTTPAEYSIKPGKFTIQVKKNGYYPSEVKEITIDYDIYEGKEQKITFELKKIE